MLNLFLQKIPNSFFQLVFLFLASLGFFYGVYLFDFADLLQQQKSIAFQKTELIYQAGQLTTQEQQLKKELVALPHLQTVLLDMQKKLIKRENLTELLDQILKIGFANHIQFKRFHPEFEVKENAYVKLPIQVEVLGSYGQITHFLSQVANMPWLVVIGNYSLAPTNQQQSANLTLEIYSLDKNDKDTSS